MRRQPVLACGESRWRLSHLSSTAGAAGSAGTDGASGGSAVRTRSSTWSSQDRGWDDGKADPTEPHQKQLGGVQSEVEGVRGAALGAARARDGADGGTERRGSGPGGRQL